jgi:hypothetical protein
MTRKRIFRDRTRVGLATPVAVERDLRQKRVRMGVVDCAQRTAQAVVDAEAEEVTEGEEERVTDASRTGPLRMDDGGDPLF